MGGCGWCGMSTNSPRAQDKSPNPDRGLPPLPFLPGCLSLPHDWAPGPHFFMQSAMVGVFPPWKLANQSLSYSSPLNRSGCYSFLPLSTGSGILEVAERSLFLLTCPSLKVAQMPSLLSSGLTLCPGPVASWPQPVQSNELLQVEGQGRGEGT